MMNKIILILLFLIDSKNVCSQTEMHQNHSGLECNLNFVQLNSSIVNDILGSQLRLNVFLHERIELLNSGSMLFRNAKSYFQNDFRVRFWGCGARKWHPGFAAEIGYLYQTKDWLRKDAFSVIDNQHGFLFGGVWDFPLSILQKGYVVAKWSYVIKPKNPNMTIFNCYVHWNLLKNIGFHVGGDIYNEVHQLKYSGFVVGLSYQFKEFVPAGNVIKLRIR